MTKLVIKGAYYYDKESDMIISSHYTGEFEIVDCNTYEKLEELEGKYNDNYIESVKNSYIKYDGRKYYSTEFSPIAVDDWELLSDLSELGYWEGNYDW